MNAPATLAVEGLTVSYGALVALSDVTWSVSAGEILGIIGPNGAGKSSCFAATTHSVSRRGSVRLSGQDVTALPTHRLAGLGLRRTFQQNSFYGDMTVLENATAAILQENSVGLLTALTRLKRTAETRKAARMHAGALLDLFGIPAQYYGLQPRDIPYGVQRVLSIALAYGAGVKALLLDEPAAGAGGDDMALLIGILKDLRRRAVAVVVIEHHMDLIMQTADRIVVIDQGRKLAEGTPAEIQRHPKVLEAYLGRTE